MTRPGPHGNDPRREPLDPVERELAERLARLGPHGEPPVAIDSRILAAAHAATHAAPRRSRRLPLAVGVAASLVLALGLAWQLRPLLDDPPPPVESDHIDMAARADRSQAAAPAAEPLEARSDEEKDAASARRAASGATQERAPAVATDTADPPPRSAPAARPEAFPAPAATRPPQPAPPPAPPPPAPATPAAPAPIAETGAVEAGDAGLRRRAAESQRSFDRGSDAAPQSMQESAASAGAAGAPEDGARQRMAQLERIRALRDAGHAAQARDELEAFLDRWPGYPLPDDLRALRR